MNNKQIDLFWHNYKLFPYEKKLALREIESLLNPVKIEEIDNKVSISSAKNQNSISKLVYFSHAKVNDVICETIQHQYESQLRIGNKIRSKRQNTRYSVHGLHEYKGKFNPQVVKSLFNIFGIKPGDKILDPFCGSGTSIVEAAHSGITAVGTDINPLAAMIANTKISALEIPWNELDVKKIFFFEQYLLKKENLQFDNSSLRTIYLKKWFPEDILIQMEALKSAALLIQQPIANIFLIIISNILRDYSLQEPSDLRIRRRKSEFPEKPFINEVEDSINLFIHNLKVFQIDFKISHSENLAYNLSIKAFDEQLEKPKETFDFVITSPPYATALPYIDTQRLSLVWLELIEATQIKILESDLIGSREFKLKQDQEKWILSLINNEFELPENIFQFCLELNKGLCASDGFRKKALPSLLYRYFCDMKLAFTAVYSQLKTGKYFALIVGHNHTMIGGKRTEINTPELLTSLGSKIGFEIHEVTQLDAYHRYGLNASNAVQSESLIVFKK